VISRPCFEQTQDRRVCQSSIEKIVSLRPDLIIGIKDGNRAETIHRLDDFGFSTYVINPRGFDGVIRTIEHIEKSLGEKMGQEEL